MAVSSLARSTVRAWRGGLGVLASCNGGWKGRSVDSAVPSRGLFGIGSDNRPKKSQSKVLSREEGNLFVMESKLFVHVCCVDPVSD